MRIGIVGMNCRTASLELREEFALVMKELFHNESQAAYKYNTVLVSTCNRVELYFSVEELANAHTDILTSIREKMKVDFEQELYTFFGADAFKHLGRVTAGMDSAIVSESEIQKQVKLAYEFASIERSLPKSIHFLFQKALTIGKRVRTTYPSAQGLPNLEHVAYQIGNMVVPEFNKSKVLFLGNSEINRRIIPYFCGKGGHEITLCTRQPGGASELTKELNISVCDWKVLNQWKQFDMIVCGTNHAKHIIHGKDGLEALKTRFIIDLGMPRNVCPQLKKHPNIHLLNIEEIGSIVNEKRQLKREEIVQSEELVEVLSDRYHTLFQEKQRPHKTAA